jgi:ATP-binding cassette subfamily C protein
MPQEASLLAGTVKENICRFENRLTGESQAIDDRAVEAAKLAGAHDLILHLPGAYDYELGLGGRGLSVGQAQRIGLARAVYGAPRYLILDEPNAHLDAEGDGQLIATLERLKRQGTTILIVAHRLSLLPVIDKLLLLREGRVALFGPKQQVLERIRPGRGPRPVVSEAS